MFPLLERVLQNIQKMTMDKKDQRTIIIQNTSSSNTMGTLGLVFAILSWPLSCFPIFGFILWILGVIFSVIGLFKKPRGSAIVGLVISFLGLILILLLILGIIGSVGFSELISQSI